MPCSPTCADTLRRRNTGSSTSTTRSGAPIPTIADRRRVRSRESSQSLPASITTPANANRNSRRNSPNASRRFRRAPATLISGTVTMTVNRLSTAIRTTRTEARMSNGLLPTGVQRRTIGGTERLATRGEPVYGEPTDGEWRAWAPIDRNSVQCSNSRWRPASRVGRRCSISVRPAERR